MMNCDMVGGAMAWLMPLAGMAILLLIGLGIAASIKYLLTTTRCGS